jgi:hypothetical protein
MPDAPTLLAHHLEQLSQGAGITPEVIAERGYRSILPPDGYSELKPYGFTGGKPVFQASYFPSGPPMARTA